MESRCCAQLPAADFCYNPYLQQIDGVRTKLYHLALSKGEQMEHDPRLTIPKDTLEPLLSFALEIAEEARALALRYFQSDNLGVEYKEPGQPVTRADIEIEELLRKRIVAQFPEHGIIGEEFPSVNENAKFYWTIDPIDGTRNFAAGIDTFGNLLGLCYEGLPIIGVIDHPARDLCIYASFGGGAFSGSKRLGPLFLPPMPPIIATSTRSTCSESGDEHVLEAIMREFPDTRIYYDCFAHSLTALGSLQACAEFNLKIWDLIPIECVICEAGGVFNYISRPERGTKSSRYHAVFGEKSISETLTRLINNARLR